MTRLQCFCLGAGLQRDRENNNKALVHKGSTPLIQMFFDVSKITVFQSPNPFTQKSNEECFKILLRKIALQEQAQTQHKGFSIFSKQRCGKGILFFCSGPISPNKSVTLQGNSFICTGGSNYACLFLSNDCPYYEL